MNILSIFTLLMSPLVSYTTNASDSRPPKTRTVIEKQTQPQKTNNQNMVLKQILSNNQTCWVPDIVNQPYDSMLVVVREQGAKAAFDTFFNDFINIESLPCPASQIPDSVYSSRLKMIMSPIPMAYNDIVKRYIVAYTGTKKTTMENILGRAQYYFPLIEEELDRAGLPVEFRMLPVIESALIPQATSRAGAAGLWQFMYNTGKIYGLEVNSYVDQRRDPIVSTKAACRMLKDLYNIYGDWTLVLAAYNCGAGNVNKAIKRAGGNVKSFWDIYNYLPAETRGYVPSFIAATYAYNFHAQHNISPAKINMPLIVDTVMVNKPLHLDQVTSTINLSKDLLRSLNPQYKTDIIPASGRSYSLTLPAEDVSRFIEKESDIHAKDSVYLATYLNPSNISKSINAANPQQTAAASYQTYKVKSGDTLSSIASRYNVTVSQLMKWNKIANARSLQIGQRIQIRK